MGEGTSPLNTLPPPDDSSSSSSSSDRAPPRRSRSSPRPPPLLPPSPSLWRSAPRCHAPCAADALIGWPSVRGGQGVHWGGGHGRVVGSTNRPLALNRDQKSLKKPMSHAKPLPAPPPHPSQTPAPCASSYPYNLLQLPLREFGGWMRGWRARALGTVGSWPGTSGATLCFP